MQIKKEILAMVYGLEKFHPCNIDGDMKAKIELTNPAYTTHRTEIVNTWQIFTNNKQHIKLEQFMEEELDVVLTKV